MRKRLEWSKRGRADVDRMMIFYAETASPGIAFLAHDFVVAAAERLTVRELMHRPGPHNTRQCVLRRFPFTIVYRVVVQTVRIVRVMHQASAYFNR